MDVDNLSLIGPGVDFNEIPAIHQKRTLAFINHFICNTVSMMNKLARSCEMKLQKFETQLQRMDASLCILEAKLSSIPGLEADTPPSIVPHVTAIATSAAPPPVSQEQQSVPIDHPAETAPVAVANNHDPRYAKFFRMVHVGVPPQAVKLKMQAEGLDPSILDNPGAAPPPPPPQAASDSDSSDDSASD